MKHKLKKFLVRSALFALTVSMVSVQPVPSFTGLESTAVVYAAALTGSGTAASPYIISDASSWDAFAAKVNSGETSACAKLSADITTPVTVAVGDMNHIYHGTFDGCGHTLTVNLSGGSYTAPFSLLNGAVIKRLKTTGTVTVTGTGSEAGGIAGACVDGSNTIQNCISNVSVKYSSARSAKCGGVLGSIYDGSCTVSNCSFTGSIGLDSGVTGTLTDVGGLVGYYYGGNITVANSLNNGTFSDPGIIAKIGRLGGEGTVTNCYSTTDSTSAGSKNDDRGEYTTKTGSELAALLGPAWTTESSSAVPIMNSNNLAIASITGVEDTYLFTGSLIKPVPTVTDFDGNVLTSGTHYTVTYSGGDFKTDGTYTIKITGKGTYTGTQSITYKISGTKELGDHEYKLNSDEDGIYCCIESTEDLEALAEFVNGGNGAQTEGMRFVQTDNLDFGNTEFTPIGLSMAANMTFKGTYDGGGMTISGISVNSTSIGIGLFGTTDMKAVIKNVNIEDSDISGTQFVGGIVGYNNGTVENCTTGENVNIHASAANSRAFGGIAGHNDGTVKNCISAAELSVDSGVSNCFHFGGIVGYNNEGSIENCFYCGYQIKSNLYSGSTAFSGAITGMNANGALKNNYYSAGSLLIMDDRQYTSNIGIGRSSATPTDVTSDNGAVIAYKISLASTLTTDTFSAKTIDEIPYSIAGKTITVSNPDNTTIYVNGQALAENTFTMPAQTALVDTESNRLPRTVTFDANGGYFGSGSTAAPTKEVSVKYNAKVTKPTSPKQTGYTFYQWTLDGTAYNFSTPVTKNITLKADWILPGDVNLDGYVTAADAAKLMKYVTEGGVLDTNAELNAKKLSAANVHTNNSNIDMRDVIALLKKLG